MKKQKLAKGIPRTPTCRSATLPIVEARMRKAFPPLASFKKKEKKKCASA